VLVLGCSTFLPDRPTLGRRGPRHGFDIRRQGTIGVRSGSRRRQSRAPQSRRRVGLRLSSGAQPERFHLISQNYSTASDAIASTGRWSPLAIRLTGLKEEAQAVDLLLSGRELEESRRLLGAAGRDLGEARSLLSATPELGYMVAAVDQELATVRTVGSMLNIVENSPSVAPHPLHYIQRL